jgi:hypothetical protein
MSKHVDKFTIKGTNLSEDITKILYHANFDIIPLFNCLSNGLINTFFFYGFKYLCSSLSINSLSININQFEKF